MTYVVMSQNHHCLRGAINSPCDRVNEKLALSGNGGPSPAVLQGREEISRPNPAYLPLRLAREDRHLWLRQRQSSVYSAEEIVDFANRRIKLCSCASCNCCLPPEIVSLESLNKI